MGDFGNSIRLTPRKGNGYQAREARAIIKALGNVWGFLKRVDNTLYLIHERWPAITMTVSVRGDNHFIIPEQQNGNLGWFKLKPNK